MTELTGKIIDMSLDFTTGKPKITLEVNERQTCTNCYEDLKDAEMLSIKLAKYRKKRSLNANNYAWKLITELAENQGLTKEEVYREYIRQVGVCRQVEIDEKAAETLIHSWSLHGLGWFSEKLDYGKHQGFVLINLFYGSSTYNTKQMSRLIDNIVQDCIAVGINVKTPDEIAHMMSLWETEQ